MKFLWIILFFLFYGCSREPITDNSNNSRQTVTTSYPNENSPMGINLSFAVSYTPAWIFLDIFKLSRPWIPQYIDNDSVWNSGEEVDTDDYGWVKSLAPNQKVSALMLDVHGQYPAGTYICVHEGEGDIIFGFDAVVIINVPGKIVFNAVPSAEGILLSITNVNANNYIKNIRVFHSDFETNYQTQIFHPKYLEKLAKFNSIRFADWGQINYFTLTNWSERTTTNSATQGSIKGAALEYMIKLCNRLNADIWINIYHTASDDYVRRLAELLTNRLKSGLKAYIEYSNEVWNSGNFPQGAYAQNMGLALGLSANTNQAGWRYYSRRSVEIFQIFEEVFGSTDRLIRVLATHIADPSVTIDILDWQDAYQHADVLAVAPYFGIELGYSGESDLSNTLSMTVDDLLDVLSIYVSATIDNEKVNYSNAQARGLKLIAYESGQHLSARQGWEEISELTTLFIEANRHERMKEIYLDYYSRWKALGGEEILTFRFMDNYTKNGAFGLLENMDPHCTIKCV